MVIFANSKNNNEAPKGYPIEIGKYQTLLLLLASCFVSDFNILKDKNKIMIPVASISFEVKTQTQDAEQGDETGRSNQLPKADSLAQQELDRFLANIYSFHPEIEPDEPDAALLQPAQS